MSLAQARSTPRGAKNAKHLDKGGDGGGKTESSQKSSKHGSGGGGHGHDTKSHASNNTAGSITSNSTVPEKINYIMGTLGIVRSENEVVAALHDCDYEVNRAVEVLLEGMKQGEWTTSGKKKKNRTSGSGGGTGARGGESVTAAAADGDDTTAATASVTSGDPATVGGSTPAAAQHDRDRSQRRGGGGTGGGPPRMRSRGGGGGQWNRGNRSGVTSDNKENEDRSGGDKGSGPGDDAGGGSRVGGGGYRRGGRGGSLVNGPGGGFGGRSGRGGRGGGRGGGLGGRTFQGRDKSGGGGGGRFPSMIDTWNPERGSGASSSGDKAMKMDTWNDFPPAEDWDNEEYTGSLADSKVFTSSGLEGTTAPTSDNVNEDDVRQELIINASSATTQDYRQSSSPLPVTVGTLNAAQTQYLTQLQQQTSAAAAAAAAAAYTAYGQTESLKSAVGIGGGAGSAAAQQSASATATTAAQAYAQSGYATNPSAYGQTTGTGYNAYNSGTSGSGAVGGAGGGGGGTSSSGGGNYATGTSGAGTYHQNVTSTGGSYGSFHSTYAAGSPFDGTNAGVNAASDVSGTQSSQAPRTKVQQRARVPPPSKIPQSAVEMPDDTISANVNSLDVEFGCLEFGSEGNSFDTVEQQTQQPTNKYPTGSNVDNNSTQTSTQNAATLDGSTASLDTYTTSAASSKTNQLHSQLTGKSLDSLSDQQKSAYTDLAKSDVTGLSYSSATSSANYASYQKTTAASGYQQTGYGTGYTTSSSTGGQPVSYPNSSYGVQPAVANSNVYTQQTYAVSSGSGGGSPNTKLNSTLANVSKESQAYSQVTTTSSSLSGAMSNATNATQSMGSLSSSAQGTATNSSTKVSSSTIKNSVVPNPNIPPPIMGAPQYIMGQAGVSYYQHPTPMFSVEDFHMLQPRIPHMTPGYDYMTYPAPTSLTAAGRDTLASVSYTTISDGRYSNASPVPSTLSQQTATAHQQPMINPPSLPPGYYVHGYAMPGGLQYSAAPFFSLPSAAAGTGNVAAAAAAANSQYAAAAKPAAGSYGSAAATYGSTGGATPGYDAATGLGQSDYSKSAYVSAGNASKVAAAAVAAVNANTATSDLYGKTHTALGKVNSYEKQGFHSGTPPPYNLAAAVAGGQSAAAAGPYAPQLFIPNMAAAVAASAPHQTLMQSHLQDSSSSANVGVRGQSAVMANQSGQNKTAGSKQTTYSNTYWTN